MPDPNDEVRPRRSDVRSRRSQKALRGALLRLIEMRPFDRITLREITAEAGVSYPTFFNHYAGKDELFQHIACSEIGDLLAAFRQGHGTPTWRPGADICRHIAARRGLWRTLLTAGAAQEMRSEFILRGRDLVGARSALPHGAPYDLVSGVIASGIFEIIAWWLGHDGDHSVEAVSDMLEALVIEPALGVPQGHFREQSSG